MHWFKSQAEISLDTIAAAHPLFKGGTVRDVKRTTLDISRTRRAAVWPPRAKNLPSAYRILAGERTFVCVCMCVHGCWLSRVKMCVLSTCSVDSNSKRLAAALQTCLPKNPVASAMQWQSEEQQDNGVRL